MRARTKAHAQSGALQQMRSCCATRHAASRITQQLAARRTAFVSGTSGPTTTVYFNTPVSWTVGYDSRDRVISFNRNTSALSRASTAYTYDANSNRLSALRVVADRKLSHWGCGQQSDASNRANGRFFEFALGPAWERVVSVGRRMVNEIYPAIARRFASHLKSAPDSLAAQK
jgi:hypothetical protein